MQKDVLFENNNKKPNKEYNPSIKWDKRKGSSKQLFGRQPQRTI